MTAAPPAGGMGKPEGRELSIDWLEFSVKHLTAGELARVLGAVLGPAFAPKCWRPRQDDKRWQVLDGPEKSRLSEDRVGQMNREGALEPWAGVRLPGAACRLTGTPALLRLLRAVHEHGVVKVSRLDLALDDHGRAFSPRTFAKAVVDGSLDDEHAEFRRGVVTRVRGKNWDWSRRKGGCFWLGGKKSPRLLRVYDKGQESEGEIDAVRVELQCRDDWATKLARDLLEAEAQGRRLGAVFCSHVVSFVDLREPTGDRSQSQKWPRVAWWADLVRDARAARLVKSDPTGSLAWFRRMCRQVRGFLQVALELYGVTPDDLVRGPRQGIREAYGRVARTVRRILGGSSVLLSPEHESRLRQLKGRVGDGEDVLRGLGSTVDLVTAGPER